MESSSSAKLKFGFSTQSTARNHLSYSKKSQHISPLTTLHSGPKSAAAVASSTSSSRFTFLKDSSVESERGSSQQNDGGKVRLTTRSMTQSSQMFNSSGSSTTTLTGSPPAPTNSQDSLLNRKKVKKRFSLFALSSADQVTGDGTPPAITSNITGAGSALSSLTSVATSATSSSAASLDLILENHDLLEWIDKQLDSRGIDSVVYGRYILSLLHSSTDSITTSSESSGGTVEDQDSGYGSVTGPSKKTGASSTGTSSTSTTNATRYCDFHQRLYPGLNLHQSRTKLLFQSGGKLNLNTQKPASTTKFMHKRYQNGRGSPSDLLADFEDPSSASRHCPDCAARNNNGTSTASACGLASQANVCHYVHHSVDYRKTVLVDCLKDAIHQVCARDGHWRTDGDEDGDGPSDADSGSIDSFVDELVNKFDRLRSQQQSAQTSPASMTTTTMRYIAGSGNKEMSTSDSDRLEMGQPMNYFDGYSSPVDDFSPSFVSRRSFVKSFSSSNNNVANVFHHSRSFEQSGADSRTDAVPWPRLSDSTTQQTTTAGSSNANNFRNTRSTFQQSKLFHRSLSDENSKGDDETKKETTVAAPEKGPTTRDQALKYFAAFPALAGKFPGSRSASVTRPSISSLSSPKSTASAKMSAQSSLDDSVFSEECTDQASWNGLKIIKNISKSNAVGAIAAVASETNLLANGINGTSVVAAGAVATKPPTLSGKNRVIVAAAPSSLLLDSSRDCSNFTTLKKKGSSNSVSVSSSLMSTSSGGSAMRKTSSTTSSSSFEADEHTKRTATQPTSNLATVSTNSCEVVTREQEKIYNIMPSFLNPLKSIAGSATSKTTTTTTTTIVSSRKPPSASIAAGSTTSTSTSNGPKPTTTYMGSSTAASTSTSTFGQSQPCRTGRIDSTRIDWCTAVQSGSLMTNASCQQRDAFGSNTATISSAVDLLPSFLKSHSTESSSNNMATTSSRNNSSLVSKQNSVVALSGVEGIDATTLESVASSFDAMSAGKATEGLYGSCATVAATTAYQHKQPREVIRSAPTTSTVRASSNQQPSHYLQHQYEAAKPDLKVSSLSGTSSGGYGRLVANVRRSSATVQHQQALVVGSSASATTTSSAVIGSSSKNSSKMILAPYHNQQYQRLSSTALQVTSTTATGLSSNDNSRLLNDYWFNFTSNRQEETAEEGEVFRERTQEKLKTSRDEEMMTVVTDANEDTDRQMKTDRRLMFNEVRTDRTEKAPKIESTESSQQKQGLVIDSKGALDEWMNSILAANKQKRSQRLEAKQKKLPVQQPEVPLQPPSTTRSSNSNSPVGGSSMQAFLDSISQSIDQDTTTDSSGNAWQSLARPEDPIGNELTIIPRSFDKVSFYWNQNCTQSYLDFVEDGRVCRLGDDGQKKVGKTFQQYLNEQAILRSEISLLSDLFHQSQAAELKSTQQVPSFESLLSLSSEQLSPDSDCSSNRRISLVNHESESSAFQEVNNKNDLLMMLHDLVGDDAKLNSPNGTGDDQASSATSYFQPIDPDQLLTELNDLDWTPVFQASSQQPLMSASNSGRPLRTDTTTNSSTACSRSISVSRAELDTYFTPELSTCSNGGGFRCDDTTTTTFYSSTGVPTTCPSRESFSAPQPKTTNSDTNCTQPGDNCIVVEKLSNSACGCKTSCNGHFVQSACCCYPDEYHYRVGLVSPPETRMCDKSTTTTDQLLDAVNATLDSLFKFQQQHQPNIAGSPSRRSCRSAMNPFEITNELLSSFMTTTGCALTGSTSSDSLHQDDDELNVNDLVNDVLRLTTAEQQQFMLPVDVEAVTPLLTSVTKASAAAFDDDYDGPPMPYSKRKKYQNEKNMIYGKFPISCEQIQEMRLRSQNKLASSSGYFESKASNTCTQSASKHDQAKGSTSNTVYYSNQSSNFFDYQPQQGLSPPTSTSPHFNGTAEHYDGPYEEGYYAQDSEPYAGLPENYVIGPDGAQYYVGSEPEDPGGDGGATSHGSGSGYSPEELFAQYGADTFAVMHHEEAHGSKGSVYPMFDLKFKTNNRTIDSTIDTAAKQNQKPCTFYMEGFCARGDCKFSHDLSSITCKYWMEGFCIKEGACPFMHGYSDSKNLPSQPVGNSKLDPNAKSFQFKIESDFDFPALAGEDEDSGYGLDVANNLPPQSTGLSSLQQLMLNDGSSYRFNFKPKSAKSKPFSSSNGTSSAAVTNGHYQRTDFCAAFSSAQKQTEEEWPSLNGDSIVNGKVSSGVSSSAKSTDSMSATFSNVFNERSNFREKVIKSKKGGKYRSASGSSGSANSASAGSSSASKMTLKGLL